MKRAPEVLLAVLVGIGLGLGSALAVLKNGQLLGRFEYDYWFGNMNAGSTAAGPYTRGIIAWIGLLALNRSETIYFHRYKDGQGRPLREGCNYRMQGGVLPARWWSITIYAADDFLPMSPDEHFSIDKTQLQRAADGSWSVRIATTPPPEGTANWISSQRAGTYSLSLRMYNPQDRAREDPASIPYPTITRLDCPEQGS